MIYTACLYLMHDAWCMMYVRCTSYERYDVRFVAGLSWWHVRLSLSKKYVMYTWYTWYIIHRSCTKKSGTREYLWVVYWKCTTLSNSYTDFMCFVPKMSGVVIKGYFYDTAVTCYVVINSNPGAGVYCSLFWWYVRIKCTWYSFQLFIF